MTLILLELVGLTAASWACIIPMFRNDLVPRDLPAPIIANEVPNYTFDHRGLV